MNTTMWIIVAIVAALVITAVYFFFFRKKNVASAEATVGGESAESGSDVPRSKGLIAKASAEAKGNPWAVAFALAIVAVLVLGGFLFFGRGVGNFSLSGQPTFQAVTLQFAPTANKAHLRSFFGTKMTDGRAAWLVDDQPNQALTTGIQSVTPGDYIVNLEVRGGGMSGWSTDDGNSMAIVVAETGRTWYIDRRYLTDFIDYRGVRCRIYGIRVTPTGDILPLGNGLIAAR